MMRFSASQGAALRDDAPTARTSLRRAWVATVDLQLMVTAAQWAVRGPHALARHALLDGLGERLRDSAADLADRYAQLGGAAPRSVRRLHPALPIEAVGAGTSVVLSAVAQQYERYGDRLQVSLQDCERIGDAASAAVIAAASRRAAHDAVEIETHRRRYASPESTAVMTSKSSSSSAS